MNVLPAHSIVANLPDPPTHRPSRNPRPDTHDADPLRGISSDRYYTALTGREVTYGNVTCPFHKGGEERTPSMRLYGDNTFNCFGCDAGGSIYEFGAALWGYSLPLRGDAFKEVQERLTRGLL